MAATYYGQIHISPHLVHVGQDITATVATAYGGRIYSWSTPPGPVVSGCKIEEPTCTWKATLASDYPPSEGRSGWSGGWEVYEATFCGFFGCAPSGDYYYVEGPHGCTIDARETRARIAESECPPTLELKGSAVKINALSGGTLDLSAVALTGKKAIKGAKVDVKLSPSLVISGNATHQKDLGDIPEASSKTAKMPTKILPSVVANGHTLGTMEKWSNGGWTKEPAAKAQRSGGYLVFSDSPEYLAPTTQTLPSKQEGGNQAEGVLYRETGGTFAATASRHSFRLYINHENRTSITKSICFVFTSDASGTTVALQHSGLKVNRGDPVAAGRAALEAYEASRRHSATGAAKVVSPTTGYAECPAGAQLGPAEFLGYKITTTTEESSVNPKTGKPVKKKVQKSRLVQKKPSKLGPGETVAPSYSPADVVNGIFDYTASGGDVQVGVVIVDSANVTKFREAPLSYKFADQAHPNGDPSRTYASGALANAGETHVSGTFPYDTVKVTLPTYDENDGKAVGALLAGSRNSEAEQYAPAVDNKNAYDTGNYGVFYQVEVKTKGESGELAQVLLNPRAVGKDEALKVTNGFAGVVDVPAASGESAGEEIPAPAKGQPGVGETGNLIDRKYGIGLGRVAANKSFSLEFMPPGGASLPVAVVLAPAYVKAEGTLTYDGGKTVKAEPKIFALQPGG